MAVMTDHGAGRETRWSANKKTDAVLRLLRGEKLDELSRELRVEAHRLACGGDGVLPPRQGGPEGPGPGRGRKQRGGTPPAAGGRTQGRRAHPRQRHPARRGAKKGA